MRLYTTLNYIKRYIKGESLKTKYFNYLKSIQHLPLPKLIDLQKEELFYLLKYAFDNIEAYKKYKNTIQLDKDTIFEAIKKIDPLTKTDIINDAKNHINPLLKSPIKYKTGGTSSNSALIYKGSSEELMNSEEYFNYINGIYSGKSRLILARSQQTYYFDSKTEPDTISMPLKKTYFYDVKYMDEKKLLSIYNTYLKIKPKILWGITRPMYDFARYIIDTNKYIPKCEICISSGQTLLPKYKETIESVFQAPLINRYASTECGDVASQCKKQEGLHYVPTLYYIEILDSNLNQVNEGEMGELYITVLNSRYFPLIRYKTNDFAIYSNNPCSCNITFPTIKHIVGRDIESLRAPNLSVVTPMPIDHILSNFLNITDFQAIQEDINGFTLNLVIKDKPLTINEKDIIKKRLCELFKYNMDIKIVIVKKINSQPNGKMLHIISKV